MDIKNIFLENGYIQHSVANTDAFNFFNSEIENFFGIESAQFENLHNLIDIKDLNAKRMALFSRLNSLKNWKELYFQIASPSLVEIIGPEISIQTKLNVSIQFPGDKNSQVPMHTDRAGGHSLFEVVCWTAFTNAKNTSSMYITNPNTTVKILSELPSYEESGINNLEEKYLSDMNFLKIKSGDSVIFSSNLYHGNVVNKEEKTRLSVNCRFKPLWAPEYKRYANERVTGQFYTPLKLLPVTSFATLFLNKEPKFE